ncbi:hypothetical protein HELRODRAFT_112481 [Helobdella robusta]|uniref:HECT-type E3 ubiquitin transferase n=1 Tax=Helobdella robusta TaxID=6412 RepID=T1EFK3_HELRO|nr:hypothetical protein HELRODRAFT_112481 [Helobdella robusta]ESO02744.1 hypothetical protein HELRODRAFT_112481 [Helobdella robusta]
MLEEKMSKLNEELLKLKAPTGHCRLEINRNNIFTESFRQIMRKRATDCYKRLLVKFKGEEGIDYGGIAREWLSLLSKEMFNPAFGLFQYTRDNQLYINPDSHVNSSHLYYFKFVGRIMALCILHGHQIDADFTLPFYKQMLRQEVTLDDLRFVDVQLYNSLVWFRTNDITDMIESTFTVNHNSFGEVHVHELKTGGSNIPVTEDNKLEYIDLYVKWRLTVGCESQMRAFLKGFNELIPIQLISEFTPQELHMMLGGLNYVDVSDWKKYTKLKHCTVDSNIVRWFWTYVDQLTTEKRQALLKFVLGSHRIPLQGFKALQGSQGPRLFTIHQVNISTNNLPRAHTCFNRIDIPAYESYDIFLEKMNCAIEETEGFNFE